MSDVAPLLTGIGASGENGRPMEVTLAVLADYASISSDKKLNILGVFNEVFPPILPFRLPQMYVVCTVEGEPAEVGREFQFEIMLWTADGGQILSLEQPLQFQPPQRPGGRSAHNVIVGMANIPFERAGDYAFLITIGGEQRRRIPIRVNEPRVEESGPEA